MRSLQRSQQLAALPSVGLWVCPAGDGHDTDWNLVLEVGEPQVSHFGGNHGAVLAGCSHDVRYVVYPPLPHGVRQHRRDSACREVDAVSARPTMLVGFPNLPREGGDRPVKDNPMTDILDRLDTALAAWASLPDVGDNPPELANDGFSVTVTVAGCTVVGRPGAVVVPADVGVASACDRKAQQALQELSRVVAALVELVETSIDSDRCPIRTAARLLQLRWAAVHAPVTHAAA